MRQYLRAAAVGLPLLVAGCNSGVDTSGLAPLTGETARTTAPSPIVGESSLAEPLDAMPRTDAAAAVAATGGTPLPAGQQISATQQGASVRTAARIEFAPVVGADSAKVQPLAARLSARAAQQGITLVNAGGAPTHVLKGYFSAFTENRDTTVIYVWDVLDGAGNRLNRIQGQQKAPTGGSQDGWNAVSPAMMEAIADRTIDALAGWLSGATG